MKQLKNFRWCVPALVSGLLSMPCIAQEGFCAAGGDTTGSTRYPFQLFYQSYSSTVGNISEGVQHALEFLTSTSVEVPEARIALSVFPNPTASSLQLKVGVDSGSGGSLRIRLLDMQGRNLLHESIQGSAHFIGLESYPAALYFLQVYQDQRLIHTFPILKT